MNAEGIQALAVALLAEVLGQRDLLVQASGPLTVCNTAGEEFMVEVRVLPMGPADG